MPMCRQDTFSTESLRIIQNINIYSNYIGRMWISPAKPQPSSKRKIFMNIKDSHNSRAKSLRWDWRILFRMLSGKKNSIHKEWKGCHSQILPPSPPSVCHAVSFSHSGRLTVSFFMTLRRDNGEHWNMITLLLNHFSQPILLLLMTKRWKVRAGC